jgi:actin-related protein 3
MASGWAGGAGAPPPAVVIDCGSGYTKLGYAGNTAPSFSEPTALAAADGGAADIGRAGASDLDCFFGADALAHAKTHRLGYPMRAGLVDDWAAMERVWHRCFFERLHVQPSAHHVLLTEPPLNPPENRELTAEVMFETFNVPGLYIGVQAVLALAASWVGLPEDRRTLTGTVVDSGDGATHVIPVADGYVLGSAIRHMPLAGRDLSLFVQRCLRERGEPVPPEDSLEVARRIKEQLCYVAQDVRARARGWRLRATRRPRGVGGWAPA